MPHQGRRTLEEAVYSDATCTPKWLADIINAARPQGTPLALDLDPCSNPRSHIIAGWTYSLEKGLDGLKLPWRGRVFRNNPFNKPLPWHIKGYDERAAGRCTEEIVLCKMETSTDWFNEWLKKPTERDGVLYYPELWLFHERVEYEEHPEIIERRRLALEAWKAGGGRGSKHPQGLKRPPPVKGSNNFCSMVVHHRFDAPTLPLWDHADLWMRCP